MTKEEINQLIHAYIIDNLRVEIMRESDWYGSGSIKLEVYLGKDNIGSSSVSL